MPRDNNTRPEPGSSESHWGSRDPENQPCRDELMGLKRLVIETRSRLGEGATPEAIADDLRARGITADPAEVARCCAEPY
jgi:hypothetical protein